jgi:hypothetical protein
VSDPDRDQAAEDLRAIVEYLGLNPSSADLQEITGLDEVALSAGLLGGGIEELSRRRHVAIVATVVRHLAAARQIAAGQTDRGTSASGWLHSARIETSRGIRSPIQVLADPVLAAEALNDQMA